MPLSEAGYTAGGLDRTLRCRSCDKPMTPVERYPGDPALDCGGDCAKCVREAVPDFDEQSEGGEALAEIGSSSAGGEGEGALPASENLATFGDFFRSRTQALLALEHELERQIELKKAGRFDHTCSDDIPLGEKLAILTEELGEVARAVLDQDHDPDQDLNEELIQVAAIAVAWVIGNYERGD